MDDAECLEAFSEHLDRLHNLARGLTRTAQDAEDLLSETWLLALRGWRRHLERDAARLLGRVRPASESQQFSEHLLSCPECRDEVEQGRRGSVAGRGRAHRRTAGAA